MSNTIDSGPKLTQVVMPLVKLLRNAHLSWDDRVAIAGAIDTAVRAHRDMEAERQHLAGGTAGAQNGGWGWHGMPASNIFTGKSIP